MRTTLTLDPDTVVLITEEVHRTRRPFKQVVNDAIRQALARPAGQPVEIVPHDCRLVGSYDHQGYNRLADALDDAALLASEPGQRVTR
jgi:hypothetical protein